MYAAQDSLNGYHYILFNIAHDTVQMTSRKQTLDAIGLPVIVCTVLKYIILHFFVVEEFGLMLLKLYCGYKYTRLFIINRVWGLKQL